jgi:HD superfamily phosphohydrolase
MAVADVTENADADKGMSNSNKIALTIILALLLAGISYAGYSWWSEAPLRSALAMIEEDVDFSTLSKEDQKARFEKWRTLDKKLTSDQKSQVNDARERQYENKDMQKLTTFFAMTKAEQKKQLVDEINRDEKRRLESEARRKEIDAKRAQSINKQKVAGAQGAQGGNANGGNGKRTSDRLDKSTPEYRAAKMEYQKLRDKTRAEMGIVTTPGGGKPGAPPQTSGKRG